MDTKAPECCVLFSWVFMHSTYSDMLNECMYCYEVCLTAKENPGVIWLGTALEMLSEVSQYERPRGLVERGDRRRSDKGRTLGEWQISVFQATNEGPL